MHRAERGAMYRVKRGAMYRVKRGADGQIFSIRIRRD